MTEMNSEERAAQEKDLDQKWDVPKGYFKSGVCVQCVHKFLGKNGCDAFPNGIPFEIANGSNDHAAPFPGDNGIQFEPREAAAAAEEQSG
ncbi:hypothetical protein KW797_01975 [Candidatus Parcubacteria bacterium]|nr:hypothetical protein [Candidatus Parcubacteria bacterium]